MELKEAFKILHNHFGTHKAVAVYLKISWVHYSNIRNKIVPIPKRMADLIILKAQMISEREHAKPSIISKRNSISV